MPNAKLLSLFCFTALNLVHVQAAQAQSSAAQMEASGNEAQYEEADRTIDKLFEIKSSSHHFFNKIGAYPSDIEELRTEGFYFGTFDTTYGTSITGSLAANSYVLTLDVRDAFIADYIAQRVNGTASDSVVTMQYGEPSQEAILDTVLSRVFDGDATRNTMEADLLMGGNNLTGVANIAASTVNADNGVFDSGVRVFSEVNLPNKSHVGLGNVENYGITDSYLGGNSNLYASQMAVTNSYNDLIATIEALTKADIGLDKVQNYSITDNYLGGSAALYASQKAVTDSFNTVNTRISNLTKADIGLSNVQNFGVTSDYRGGSSSMYATQRAVTDSHNKLDNEKVDRGETVSNADSLDGLNSSQFIRSDTNDVVTGHTEWQDNYSVRLGSSADFRIFHNGSNSHLDNYTGHLYTRNLAKGGEVLIEATNSSGSRYEGFRVTSYNGNVYGQLKYNSGLRLEATSSGATTHGNMNVTGNYYVDGQRLDKADIGLSKVMNYNISDSYTGGSSSVYASQRAVTNAYNSLNNSKLGKGDKAADSDRLDGLSSEAFVRTSRRINGKSLTSDINLSKSDIGLSKVSNYSATNDWNGTRTDLYATQRAVKNAYDAAVSKISGNEDFVQLYKNSSGLTGGDFNLSRSWRGYRYIIFLTGDDGKSEFYTKRFSEAEHDTAVALARSLGTTPRFNVISQTNRFWHGYFSSDTRFTTSEENSRLFAVYGVK